MNPRHRRHRTYVRGKYFPNNQTTVRGGSAGGHKLPATGYKEAYLDQIKITQVLVVPGLGSNNLLSWAKLAEQGFKMEGEGTEIRILKQVEVKPVAKLSPTTGLYLVPQKPQEAPTTKQSFLEWYSSSGHMPASKLSTLRRLVQDPENLPTDGTSETCTRCALGKSKRLPVTKEAQRTKKRLQLVHSDLSGQFSVQAPEDSHITLLSAMTTPDTVTSTY